MAGLDHTKLGLDRWQDPQFFAIGLRENLSSPQRQPLEWPAGRTAARELRSPREHFPAYHFPAQDSDRARHPLTGQVWIDASKRT